MKLTIRGKGNVILDTRNDYIGSGGTGNVYVKANTIYKVYHDPSKVIPEGKLVELSVLNQDNILRPLETLMKDNTRVGFTMHRVIDAYPLCKLFTRDFCYTYGITDDIILKLIEKIKHTIRFIHNYECLMVDGNEFNYLVSKDFHIPYFIDVDSYQTKNYPAQVIMESIRDWHCNKFTELSDWFSFAIIACQLLAKIHPFKGKNSNYKGLKNRMVHNLSIFNKDTRVPAVANIQAIPQSYKDWFYALFEQGQRVPPPDLAALPVQIVKQILKGCDAFDINEVYECIENILYYTHCNGVNVIKTSNHIKVNRAEYQISKDTEVIITNQQLAVVFARIKDKKLILGASGPLFDLDLACEEKMVIDNTLFVKYGSNLIELSMNDSGLRILLSVKIVWNIMPNSSILFSNVIYQSILGKPFLVIPQPNKNGCSMCHVIPVRELEGYHIINAKHDNRVCILAGYKDNVYNRIILKFSQNYTSYSCKIINDVDTSSVNFIVLDNGIVVNLAGDSIEIFSNDLNNKYVKIIEDTGLANVKLTKSGNQVLFIRDNKVYSIKIKKV